MLRGLQIAVVLSTLVVTVLCNFDCVCIYHAQPVTVYDTDLTTVIGAVNNHECKASAQQYNTDSTNWVAIVYNMKLGYIRKENKIEVDVCQGQQTALDILNTSSIVITSTSTTSTTHVTSTTELYTVSTTSTPVVTTGVCPQIVQEHASDGNNIIAIRGQTCYEIVAHRTGAWLDVEKDCQTRGGHLIDIASAEEQTFISILLSNNSFRYDVLIGLNDRHVEETFEWSSDLLRNTVTYMNWLPGRKSQFFHSSEDCVYMSHNNSWQWDDSQCSGFFETDRHFMCQYRTVDPSTVVITTPPPSPDGNTELCPLHNINHAKQFNGVLAQNGHSCYELLPRTKYTWSHGESICQSHGGHLAHISSAAEQSFIQGFMTRHSPQHAVWIGLHDLGREGHFEWISGNPVAYLNWVSGHSDHFANHNVEDCVAFIPYEGGKWDDIPCGSTGLFGDVGEKHPLLCQYNTVKDVIVG